MRLSMEKLSISTRKQFEALEREQARKPTGSTRHRGSPRSGLSTPESEASPPASPNRRSIRPRSAVSPTSSDRVPDGTILLNIYDVVEHPFNYALAKLGGLGIHHTGIQIGTREFAFTLEGIVVTEPHRIPRCKLTHRILLTREATEGMVQAALAALQARFTPRSYDPLRLNCNHFTDAFCELIGDVRVPTWVNRAPSMASLLGTRFKLRPARVTAPALAWSSLLVDADRPVPAEHPRYVDSPRGESPPRDDRPQVARRLAFESAKKNNKHAVPKSTVDTAPSAVRDLRARLERNASGDQWDHRGRRDHRGSEQRESKKTAVHPVAAPACRAASSQPSTVGASSSVDVDFDAKPLDQATVKVLRRKIPLDRGGSPNATKRKQPPAVSASWSKALMDLDDDLGSVSVSSLEDLGSVSSPAGVHHLWNQERVLASSTITAFEDRAGHHAAH